MTGIDTYYHWNITAPAVLSSLLWLGFTAMVAILIPVFEKPLRVFVEMLQLSLPDLVDDDGTMKIDDKDITLAFYILAIVMIPIASATIYFTFWNVWLVEEEPIGACLAHFDCFPMVGDVVLQHTPVDNCSQVFNISSLVEQPNTTVATFLNQTGTEVGADVSTVVVYKCYRFVFRYAEGIGAAGGVLFFTGILSKIYFGLLVDLVRLIKNKPCIGWISLVLVWVIAGVLCLLFPIVNAAPDIVRDAVFRTDSDIVQFFFYALNFLAVVVGGVIVSIGVYADN